MSKILKDKFSEPSSDITQKINKVKRLAWIIWSVAMVAQLFNMFHRIAVPAAIDRIMADMKITGSAAGNIMAMYFYIYAIMQFPSGVFADFLGARKTITFGCLGAGLAFGMMKRAGGASLAKLGSAARTCGCASGHSRRTGLPPPACY